MTKKAPSVLLFKNVLFPTLHSCPESSVNLISGKIGMVSVGQWKSGGNWGGSQQVHIDPATPWDWEAGGGARAL